MASHRFEGTLEAARGGGAIVVVPPEVAGALGGGRLRVRGSLNGIGFSSSTMPMGGGRVCLGVHKATRESAGVSFGDTVAVTVERDESPRELLVPPELADALAADDVAAAAFDRLSFTRRREYAESISGAKREETRARRLRQVLGDLHDRAT